MILVYLDGLRELAREHIRDRDRRAAFLKEMARTCMDQNAVFDEQETLRRLLEYGRAGADSVQRPGGSPARRRGLRLP